VKNLKGKVAVVTGAASGIGRAMAERFAREGMKVVLADVDEKLLGEVCDAIAKSGAEAIAICTDVSSAEQVDALARRTFDAHGAAHIICNNAGVGPNGLIWEVPLADWNWIVSVNLMGVVHGIRAFVPRMIEQGEGHIVNTASIAGLLSVPRSGAYCATKHAVVAMSECLHHDLALAAGGKVKVSVICPAFVKTRIWDVNRNRPTSAHGGVRTRQDETFEAMTRAAVDAGISPEVVAENVLQAVVADKFWVLTHPKTKKLVEKRMTGILEDLAPVFEFRAT
jgi:NAD(P)-dependent dehydrogenase (short-subunit alcohol dehydrogenase family)